MNKHFKSIADWAEEISKNIIKMIPLTKEEEKRHHEPTYCDICGKEFSDDDIKIHDLSHLTGGYRGTAHNFCNLNYQDSNVIPVVFHNLGGDGCHYLINDIANRLPDFGITYHKVYPTQTEYRIPVASLI